LRVLTTETLASAINFSPEYSHMGDDESSYLAEHILNFFGYSDRIIDNVLHPEDRDTFYMLEDAGLMETEREETTLYDGREWRIHYWLLKIVEIERRTDAGPKYAPEDLEPSVYDEIPDDIWSREN
tara:strand:- start:111 stop:488 length:378 start_codon:yes stop_codon:yes gene_type:complete